MSIASLTDIELLQRIRQDDAAAFETLYLRLWKPLFLFAMKRLRSEEDAADVVQEVFASLWSRRHELEIKGSIDGYIYTATKYKVLDQADKMLTSPVKIALLEESVHPLSVEASESMIAREMESRLSEEINALPQKMQEIYRMHAEQDLSVAAIAQKLKLSEQTVRNQLNMAKGRLKTSMKQALLLCFLLVTIP